MCLERVGSMSDGGITAVREGRAAFAGRLPAILRRVLLTTFERLTARGFVRAFAV